LDFWGLTGWDILHIILATREEVIGEMESPLVVWRQARGLSQREFAAACGVRATYLSEAERGWGPIPGGVLALLVGAMDQDAYEEFLVAHGKWMDETRRLSADKLRGAC